MKEVFKSIAVGLNVVCAIPLFTPIIAIYAKEVFNVICHGLDGANPIIFFAMVAHLSVFGFLCKFNAQED